MIELVTLIGWLTIMGIVAILVMWGTAAIISIIAKILLD